MEPVSPQRCGISYWNISVKSEAIVKKYSNISFLRLVLFITLDDQVSFEFGANDFCFDTFIL